MQLLSARGWALAIAFSTMAMPGGASAQQSCPTFKPAASLGSPAAAELKEISGMVASRNHPGVLWVHNDSGDSARIFAVTTNGTLLGTYTLGNASAVDWEDISLGPGPEAGTAYLYIGDIGDNGWVRAFVTVYRIPEPEVSLEQQGTSLTLNADAFRVEYPEAPETVYDSEALMVDPADGAVFMITKQRDSQSSVKVFRAAALVAGETTVLQEIADWELGANQLSRVTGADVSADGSHVLVRQYGGVRYWKKGMGQTLSDVLSVVGCPITVRIESQSEAIAFAPYGLDFYTTSERPSSGALQPIFFHERVVPVPEGEVAEGEGQAEGEGATPAVTHSADTNGDHQLELAELLRVVQLFNAGALHCSETGEDGYSMGEGDTTCGFHSSDFLEPRWVLSLTELLRGIQLFNLGSFEVCSLQQSEDGFCPVAA